MNGPLLMAVLTAPARGTSAPAPNHGAIVLPLLFVLGSVVVIGALLVFLVRRQRRGRGSGFINWTDGPSTSEFRSGRMFHSSIFHCPSRWVAVKTVKPEAVQAALRLHNPTPCSWTDGMARVSDQKLFISPAINGWVLVVGSLVPEPGEDVDACFRFLQRLSRELGEVQFFSINRAVGHHAWARFERGRAIRGYAWAGETLWNQGHKTWAERKLGLKCYDYCEGESRNHFSQLERNRANTEKILLLASIWSLDPSSIDDRALADAFGIAGDLSPARPR